MEKGRMNSRLEVVTSFDSSEVRISSSNPLVACEVIALPIGASAN